MLCIDEQPYTVVKHGVITIRGVWGPLAWEEMQRAWERVMSDIVAHHLSGNILDAVAYEVPGWAGQSGESRSGYGTSHNTRRMLAQAEALFGAVAAGYARRVMALDQAEVKLVITGQRRADKTQVSLALELRRQDGEWAAPEGENGTWSDHEVDSLSIALYAAALLRREAMT